MTLREWSGWKVIGVVFLWLLVGLSLIGWSLVSAAKAAGSARALGGRTVIVFEPAQGSTMTMVAIHRWELALLLIPPALFLLWWMHYRRRT